MRTGDYLEGMLSDYMRGKNKTRPQKCYSSNRLVTILTCFQFAFAVYATFLLYFMSPSIDLTSITQQWKQLIVTTTPHVVSHYEIPTLINSSLVCEHEKIDFDQKKSNDATMIKLKTELYNEILDFQRENLGTETLSELLSMKSVEFARSEWYSQSYGDSKPFQAKTLCAQIDSLLHQTLPFHHVWVLSFGSPNEKSLKNIVDSYNNSRISFVSSTYDFKYYGRFQVALQTEGDFVYVLDDDMIPGRKMLEILSRVAGTEKYKNSVLGSIGRILPFRQKDFTFPSYRKFRSKEAGLYLPDPAYDIVIDRVVRVDFLSSSWFLSADLVKTLFIETPFTFMTGEDLHLSYQLQKYRDAGSFVLPVDPNDKETWGDSEHRLAYVSETTVIFKDIVQVRDDQWWKALSTGYITQWAAMYPQKIDALFYAHSVEEIKALSPLIEKFRTTTGKKAYVVVSGGTFCPCEEAVMALKWPKSVCKERRFKIFDLGIGALSEVSNSEVPVLQAVYASMKGLIKIHNPSIVITVSDIDPNVKKALKMASEINSNGSSALVLLPRSSVPKALWMADLRPSALPNWNRMRLTVSIITQNRAYSLTRLLKSLADAYYLGDEVPITFNMDSKVDEETLKLINCSLASRPKNARRRIIQGGLIRSTVQLGRGFLPKHWREFYVYMNMRFTEDAKQNPVQIPKSRTNGWQASWKKFLIDMMYLRGYAVSLKGLKAAGAKLGQDILECNPTEIVVVNHETGLPSHCATF
ncbi:hypothetical protein DH2020_028143 [Rehmannia glutinosa]|uniref:Uncharacterized protein n=1 Tax=Rehmannia glutinosa TaxID=99300 RepID=A0ABR0VS58_REHGL